MNYQWNYTPPTQQELDAATELAHKVNISSTVAYLLIKRGIRTEEDARKYLRPQLHDLHDPFLMTDMDLAVERLNTAMGRKERILIYGDYDVDGCTAVALVYRFLKQYYSNLDYYIPDRYEEGYGVSRKGIEYAKETDVKLIIILDCGIKAVEAITYAKSLGIDFIICDHHMPDETLPPAVAILNAKRKNATYPYKHLSGCGVGFKLVQAFALSNGIPFSKLVPLLDLVVVSIAADIVPIMGENRILAYHGMKQLNNNPSIGLKAIIEICGLTNRDIYMTDIIFKMGPRINASGRIQNGKESVRLLIEGNYDEALKMAKQIDQYNAERKELDRQMTEEASKFVAQLPEMKDESAIVIVGEGWHKGVIGIVASRLTELYFKPAVVLTVTGNEVTGSARSVMGFDVYKAIENCKDLLDNFGGHTYAAGLSMQSDKIEEFKERFIKYVSTNIRPEQIKPALEINLEISFKEITNKLHSDLKRMRPFGPENPKPIFCTHQVYDYGTSKVVGRDQEHIKLELVDNKSSNVMNGIAFGQSSEARYIKTKRSFDIAYSIEENTHKKGEVQLLIEDIKTHNDETKSGLPTDT